MIRSPAVLTRRGFVVLTRYYIYSIMICVKTYKGVFENEEIHVCNADNFHSGGGYFCPVHWLSRRC